jgi:hypothetical protein
MRMALALSYSMNDPVIGCIGPLFKLPMLAMARVIAHLQQFCELPQWLADT